MELSKDVIHGSCIFGLIKIQYLLFTSLYMSAITTQNNNKNTIIGSIFYTNRISSHKLLKGRTGKPKPVSVKTIIQLELISSRGINFSCNIIRSYFNIIFMVYHGMSFFSVIMDYQQTNPERGKPAVFTPFMHF